MRGDGRGATAGFMHRYGWDRDELYFRSAAHHPALGYVDFPPLTAWVGWLVDRVAPDSLVALRATSLLAGAATVVLVAFLARELGGGPAAQWGAALCWALTPYILGSASIFHPTWLDALAWVAFLYVATRLVVRDEPRLWPLLGVIAGIGLEAKYTIAFLLAAFVLALLIGGERWRLATRGPWIAAALALALLLPNLVWQAAHGWPSLDFFSSQNAKTAADTSRPGYVAEQLLFLGATAVVAGAGIVWLWRRRLRALALVPVLATLLFLVERGRSYYALPAAALPVAAGAVAFAGWLRPGRRFAVAAALIALQVAVLALAGPIVVPVYSTAHMVRSGVWETGFFDDEIGWPELAVQVERAWSRLSPAQRAGGVVLAENYGEASALLRAPPEPRAERPPELALLAPAGAAAALRAHSRLLELDAGPAVPPLADRGADREPLAARQRGARPADRRLHPARAARRALEARDRARRAVEQRRERPASSSIARHSSARASDAGAPVVHQDRAARRRAPRADPEPARARSRAARNACARRSSSRSRRTAGPTAATGSRSSGTTWSPRPEAARRGPKGSRKVAERRSPEVEREERRWATCTRRSPRPTRRCSGRSPTCSSCERPTCSSGQCSRTTSATCRSAPERGCSRSAAARAPWRACWPASRRSARSSGSIPRTSSSSERGSSPTALPNLRFVVGDGRALPFEDGSFDAVVCHTSLCHIRGPERVLAEAARVATDGGWLALFDGDYATTTVATSATDPLQACADATIEALVHDRFLVRRLPTLVSEAGWELVRVRSHGYVETDEPSYMLTIVARGADTLVSQGRLGGQAAEALKDEARRRVTDGAFFGHIAYASVIARLRQA